MDANIITAIFGLAGTILGGSITIAINFLNHYFQNKREKEQWERNQQIERLRYEEEQKRQNETKYHEIVSNCIKFLSLHLADIQVRGIGRLSNTYPYFSDCVMWVTEFSLFPVEKNEQTKKNIHNFLVSPTGPTWVSPVLIDLIKISRGEK